MNSVKVLPFKITKPEQDALTYKVDIGTTFYNQLHQHEEIQFSLIIKGEGTLIVGDSINDYNEGDILVIGSNLPHVFKSDQRANQTSHMLTLFFTKTSFGNHFFELEELQELHSFFNRAAMGFKIISDKEKIIDLFYQLDNATKLEQFIILLNLLKIASIASNKSLSSFIYDKKYSDIEGKRMRDIFEYTMDNYNKDVSLETISDIANITKNAFCKYFKKRTNKTYFAFLNELRIEYACKQLISDKDESISFIAEHSGFSNISNFNRQFKALKGLTPTEFRKYRH